MSDSKKKLPPIDFKKDIEEHEAYSDSTKLEFKKCNHKEAKPVPGGLRCPCGAGWQGPRIRELQRLLSEQS